MSLKRPRSPSLLNEIASKADAFEAISSDLCLYLLRFAYKDYARLVRVCRRFWTILRSKEYWKWVGKYALKDMVPTHVLQDVDFFHGLTSNDPPWGWLGSLVLGRFEFNSENKKLYILGFTHENGLYPELRISWLTKSKAYSLTISKADDEFLRPVPSFGHATYFNHPFLKKRSIFYHRKTIINYYVQLWDEEKQKTWYGESGHMEGIIEEDTLHLLYPNEKSSGVWV